MHTIQYLIVIFSVLLITSCRREQNQVKRKDILSHQEMVNIMAEVHLVESLVNEKRNTGRLQKDEEKFFFRQLFDKHGINKEIFYNNVNYYLNNPEEFKEIYEEAIQELSKKQGAVRPVK